MSQTEDSKPAAAIKEKQANIQLTVEQDHLLKQYCVRNKATIQEAIIKSIRLLIPGF
jgi:hypothetical protein